MGGVSMYFIGTGHDRSETVDSKGAKAQLFPWFHDNLDEGVVNREKFLFDGPGSGGLTNSKVNFWKKYRGVALGEGWKKNRDRAIQALSEYGGSRICVNLVGHSRGAVTCHMLAHAIKREYKGMIVRIFAVDPVPGGETDFGAQAEIIPSNVSEYVQILMENDSSMGFGVMGPKRLHFESSKTQRRKLAMPGKHGDCIKIPTQAYPASIITVGLLAPWLQDGQVRSSNIVPQAAQVEAYAAVWLKYRKNGNKPTASSLGVTGRVKRAGQGLLGVVGNAAGAVVLTSPTLLGAAIASPIASNASSYWANDRSQDVPNSMRSHRFYLNSHHKSLVKLQTEFREWLHFPLSENSKRRLKASLPYTYQVLDHLGYMAPEQGRQEVINMLTELR
jgi:hypothetical protein